MARLMIPELCNTLTFCLKTAWLIRYSNDDFGRLLVLAHRRQFFAFFFFFFKGGGMTCYCHYPDIVYMAIFQKLLHFAWVFLLDDGGVGQGREKMTWYCHGPGIVYMAIFVFVLRKLLHFLISVLFLKVVYFRLIAYSYPSRCKQICLYDFSVQKILFPCSEVSKIPCVFCSV